jgi:hypothetical protein
MPLLLAMTLIGAGEVDWGAKLRRDADRFREVVLDSHPGPVDPRNPEFRATLAGAHARALRRARNTRSHPAYAWALRELTAAFDDGHLGIEPGPRPAQDPPPDLRWPGFATTYEAGRHRVVMSDEPGAPAGAALVACDGKSADAIAAARVGRFTGRWGLKATRAAHGVYLFLPPDNPWLRQIARCTFEVDGSRRTIPLKWRPVDQGRREAAIDAAWTRYRAPIALERVADGSFWIGMGSFDGDPGSEAGGALTALNAEIAARAGEIRRAPRVVFDLRGNSGGSSSWADRALDAIWGAGAVAAGSRTSKGVDWRVSDANIAQIKAYRALFAPQRATDPFPYEFVTRVAVGMEQARARGAPLWSEPPETDPEPENGSVHAVSARAFVLTDSGCASACLDAVDVLIAMGATHVGRETSADTFYMEVREETTADGARIRLPMKVYRGRPRGSNAPATPKHEWTGAMGDTAGIRRWITSL